MKEKSSSASNGSFNVRITRSRAAALRENRGLPPLKAEKKRTQRDNSKRIAIDENSCAAVAVPNKNRAVLKDVTNICRESSYKNCITTKRLQPKVPQLKACDAKSCSTSECLKLAPVSVGSTQANDDRKEMVEGLQAFQSRILDSQDSTSVIYDAKNTMTDGVKEILTLHSQDTVVFMKAKETKLTTVTYKAEAAKDDRNSGDPGRLTALGIVDIDADHRDLKLCSSYASDIYENLRAAELIRRPSSKYMETLQGDINSRMRGILIDWLVEVSEEYDLAPDSLYLTVNMIDQFLSENYVVKQKLQLLGITCMLIASKYEEVTAPRVDEFCSITDNTYKKEEVLEMEIQVLNQLQFQLSIPTIKKFLRRFIRAAQACYKDTPNHLVNLTNYLAELTLIDYGFIDYLPSVVAASAVFVARWTLNQSDHPWNSTLVHHTSYTASDLRGAVFALQELQMNVRKDDLNAIREKYKQEKFNSVAALTSPELVQSLFS